MEDLLASIRKAINEDIGPETIQSTAKARMAPRIPIPAPADDQGATIAEIQQLREKITRSRMGAPAAARDPAQRAASLAAALRSQTPRRAWRDLEPTPQQPPLQPQSPPPQAASAQQPAPRLRTTIIEPDAPRPSLKPEPAARSTPRYTLDRPPTPQQPALPAEATSVPVLREPERAQGPSEAAILSGGSAQAVQSAFGRLADSVLARASGDQSIEEITRELLQVMLKQWLDDNLPELVERLVREEIERVARTGR
jgi:cell pole-organizing protein PopZ